MVLRRTEGAVRPLEQTRERRARQRAALVPRTRLMKRLDAVLDGGVACVVAPAGFGKTTAVRSWVLQHARSSATGSGELRLPGHTGPADRGGAGEAAGEDGEDGGRHDERAVLCRWWWHDASPESTPATFLPDLTSGPQPGGEEPPAGSQLDVLVVDDAHLLRPAVLAQTLGWVHDNPGRARLVLISRWGQSREISRARLPEPPIELRAEDLRFSLAESRELLQMRVGTLCDGHEAAILERTSGWVAGLRLAAVGLEQAVRQGERNGQDPHAAAREFVSQLSGDDRAIADFLTVEVLSSMPHRDLAVLAAVCGRRTGPLFAPLPPIMVDPAEVLVRTQHLGLRGHDAIETLNRFAENELFVVVSGGRWRVHPLLVATVRGLVATTPALITAAQRGHAAAAQWHASNGRARPALAEAIGARRADLVADALIEFGPELVFDARSVSTALLSEAFDVLGPGWRTARPHLLPLSALWRLAERDVSGAVARVESADVLDDDPDGPEQVAVWGRARADLALARLWLARLGVFDTAVTLDDVKERMFPTGPTAPASSEGVSRDCLLLTATGEVSLVEGRFADGVGFLTAALRLFAAEQAGGRDDAPLRAVEVRARALALLCGVGDRAAFDRITARLGDRDGAPARPVPGGVLSPFAIVRLTRAFLAHQAGDRRRAALELARAEAGVADPSTLFPVVSGAARAWLAVALGEGPQAAQSLARMREHRETTRLPQWLAVVVAGVELVAAGSSPATDELSALRVVEADLSALDLAAPGVARALAFVAANTGPGANTGSGANTDPGGDAPDELRAGLLEAVRARIAELQAGPRPAAGVRIPSPGPPSSHASLHARPSASAPASALASASSSVSSSRAEAARRAAPAAVVTLPEPLTPRELDVLRFLDGPAHYDDIAEELFLSRNTVKTHVKAVYRKLGVNGRVAAVRLGRELGLLDER